ncbi:MAG: hypothetical protein WAT66_12840 [Actinomycetota bacterium]
MPQPATKSDERRTPLEAAMVKRFANEKKRGDWFTFDPGYAAGNSSAAAMCSYIRNGKASAQRKEWVPAAGWEAAVHKKKDGRSAIRFRYTG